MEMAFQPASRKEMPGPRQCAYAVDAGAGGDTLYRQTDLKASQERPSHGQPLPELHQPGRSLLLLWGRGWRGSRWPAVWGGVSLLSATWGHGSSCPLSMYFILALPDSQYKTAPWKLCSAIESLSNSASILAKETFSLLLSHKSHVLFF